MANRKQLRVDIRNGIKKYEDEYGPIPGITKSASRGCFVEQVVESIHRVEYARRVTQRGVAAGRADPLNEQLFNPLLAAIYEKKSGNTEEAFWLVFLFTHFGKGRGDHWRYSRELYGRLGQGGKWDWDTTSKNPKALEDWILDNSEVLSRPGASFGNHRKYESWSSTGNVVDSYVQWIGKTRSHMDLIGNCIYEAAGDPKKAFDCLYKSMSSVYRFGRMGKFDYLTMLAKIGLADIEPGYVYVAEATGPRIGGRILFGNTNMRNKDLELRYSLLSECIDVDLQVMEDSVCNWQKSPNQFTAYRI